MNLADLQDLLVHTADGAYVVDQNQRIVAWNEAAETLLGFTAPAVQGQPCYQIIGGHGDGGCMICRRDCQPFLAGRRGEIVASFDVQVRTADGPSRWVNAGIIALTITDHHGNSAPVVIHLLRDVNARKQAETFALEVAVRARQLTVTGPEPQRDSETDALINSLTSREYQVLSLLTQGMDTDAIASALVIGKPTVRNHVQRILHKLNVHSRLEAVTLARQQRLVK